MIIPDGLAPGRYRLTSPARIGALLGDIDEAGWVGRTVDGAAMADRATLFAEFAGALAFPSWFGGNWDAYLDCLRDLSWLPGLGVVVLWRHVGSTAPRLLPKANDVLDEAIESRVEIGLPPLYVLLPAPARSGAGDARGNGGDRVNGGDPVNGGDRVNGGGRVNGGDPVNGDDRVNGGDRWTLRREP